MELWFTEKQTPNVEITCRVKKTLHREKTPFQELAVLETAQFGRMLVLDGAIMLTQADEFVYHEMMTHVPLFTHPAPRRVAVIGGGDGGSIREILRHPEVEEAHLIEIDERVSRNCQEYLPDLAGSLEDPRVRLFFEDGLKKMEETEDFYDVICVDSTDPVGPGKVLFTQEFYTLIARALHADGMVVAQTESPFFNPEIIRSQQAIFRALFPVTRLYLAAIPTYPSGLWSFSLGSKKYDPLAVKPEAIAPRLSGWPLRYYTPELHRAAFVLPAFVQELLEEGK